MLAASPSSRLNILLSFTGKQTSSFLMRHQLGSIRSIGINRPRVSFTTSAFSKFKNPTLSGRFFTHSRGYVTETPLVSSSKEEAWRRYASSAVSVVVLVNPRIRRFEDSIVNYRWNRGGSAPSLE